VKCRVLSLGLEYFADKHGYDSIFSYIRKEPISSVQQLLPVYDYLLDAKTEEYRMYGEDAYPENTFLENLNASEGMSRLKDIVLTNISGIDTETLTVTGFRVEEPSITIIDDDSYEKWEYGKPEGFDDIFGDRGILIGSGDGTVPLRSSSFPQADEEKNADVDHRNMPGDLALATYRSVVGSNPQYIPKDQKKVYDGIVLTVYSPVQIVSVVNENGDPIPEDTIYHYRDDDPEMEYLVITNPEEGNYTIVSEGVGEGEYEIRAHRITQNETTEEIVEEKISFFGTANMGEKREMSFAIDEEGGIEEVKEGISQPPAPQDTTAPEARIGFDPEIKNIAITGIDDVSQGENIIIQTENFTEEEIITIPCRNTPWWKRWKSEPCEKAITKNFTKTTLIDEAGNETSIVWEEKEHDKNTLFIIPISLSYNGEEVEITDNSIRYAWHNGRRNHFLHFSSFIRSDEVLLSSLFFPFHNKTLLWEYDFNSNKHSRLWESGMTMPYWQTSQGQSFVGYKESGV
jgi:hypothetical protein